MEYTDQQIEHGWNDEKGQGNHGARQKNHYWTVTVHRVSKQQALDISRIFLKRFHMPTCCHYDGKDISMNCIEAGHGAEGLKQAALAIKDTFELLRK